MGEVKHSYQSWYAIFEEIYSYADGAVNPGTPYDCTPLVEGTVVSEGNVTADYLAPKSMKMTIPDSTLERFPIKDIGADLYLDDIVPQKTVYNDGQINAYVQNNDYLSSAMGVRSDSTPNVPQFTAPGETPPSYTIHAYNTIESYQAFGCVIKDYTLECKAEQLCTQNITFLHHKTDNITPDWTAPTAIVYNTAVRQHFSDVAIVINGYNISDLFMKGFTLKITNEFHPTVILDGYYRKAPVLKSRNITMDVEFEANASDFQIDRFAALPTEFGVAVKLGTTDSEVIKTYWNNMCVDSIDWQPLSDPGEVYTYKMGLKNGAGFSYTDGIHNGESKVDKTINITISA